MPREKSRGIEEFYPILEIGVRYSDVQFVSKICRKTIFFHPSLFRQKIRQVSGEFSTFGLAKNRVPNYIFKLLHFAL
jgi:hypothetical protein